MNLDFSRSPYEGLRYYERGYVKEGVGAGGTAFIAHVLTGKSVREIEKSVNEEYERLMRVGGGQSVIAGRGGSPRTIC